MDKSILQEKNGVKQICWWLHEVALFATLFYYSLLHLHDQGPFNIKDNVKSETQIMTKVQSRYTLSTFIYQLIPYKHKYIYFYINSVDAFYKKDDSNYFHKLIHAPPH